MYILSHRGFWHKGLKKNSIQAINKAIENGWGIETDFRDYMGDLVISHDIADKNSEKAEEVFKILENNKNAYVAINIKADGLKYILKGLLDKYKINNYFAFDMSIPQTVEYAEAGIKYFSRQSEFEPNPYMYEQADGVWMDAFYNMDWITVNLINNHIANNKKVCLVSPELHNNKYNEFWTFLKNNDLTSNNILLCTDYPDLATKFFGGKFND